MPRLDIPQFNSLDHLVETSLKMQDVVRWGKFVQRGEAKREDSLQHSYTASLLAAIVIENEKKYSNGFDPYLVLKATLVHDLGEIEEGDTVYIDKTVDGDKRELEFFRRMTAALPQHIKDNLEKAYNLQNSGKPGFEDTVRELGKKYPVEIKLFEAIERLGYVIFAYGQYSRDGKEKILVQVLRNNQAHLQRLAGELKGFGELFYTSQTDRDITEFLKGYEGRFIERKGEQ